MATISKVYTRRRKKASKISKTLELPMDLVLDIISRLPVKSVFRCKSVSKAWYNMVKNPSFIKKHQEYANLNPNPTFGAILSIASVNKKEILRVNLMEALEKPIDLDLPFLSGCIRITVLGMCNGLVCLALRVANDLSRVCICNPLTGEFRLVPGIGEGCTFFEFSSEEKHTMYLGFCLNGDKGYELFKIVYEYLPDDDEHTMILEGVVYSLTTNTWREFDVNWGDFEYLEDHSKSCNSYHPLPVFERGVFYWGATDFSSAYIVSFDVKNEVFDEFLAPFYCTDKPWILTDLKREAAVVEYHDDYKSFDIWVLDEEQKDWVLKLEVKDHEFDTQVTVLGCVESGELVVQDYDDDKISTLSLYNTDTGDIYNLPYVNAEKKCNVFLYTESLVSVNVVDNVA